MKLLYSEEHLRCIHYDQGKNPVIEVVSIEKNESWENLPLGNKLIFLLSGEISFSYGQFINYKVGEKNIIYLPTGFKFSCNAFENSTLFVMSIQGHKNFCEDYLFKDLEKKNYSVPDYSSLAEVKPAILEINEALEKYIDTLLLYVNAGAKCKSFYMIKIKELFHIFRWFYPKDSLKEFFRYSLKGGSEFGSYIMDNWQKYASVGELAEAMNYTVSGFEKRFKRVFGVSPYKWMLNQKAERIFHQIRMTDLTFKQISANFGFTSLSRFNDFCKSNFGNPPGNIRENNGIGGKHE
ncbi:helix-turn-helix transcriptional regulator [Dysgonomonas sp. Marseille-P4677]|uniref:helix-turn-helix domain-containing protein n=1 Tax=Dysgonomonas sp. Marseille-P4677 TaxID=2364790 RepID=UPI001912D2C8|nr:helix-turn-helix domain-containing protein [Dysgonomonas sp. Marseille-P4677]MBK5719713.1 helix-turn-helix transcriptional regulator [Dysgonomonas sp. Marseille-P4677]